MHGLCTGAAGSLRQQMRQRKLPKEDYIGNGGYVFMRRKLRIAAAACMVMVLAAGCGQGNGAQTSATTKAAETFARVEGILPAPESSHAIKVAIDEAMKCKETGEEKNIVFGLTGTGYFDMVAYQKYNDGEMSDYIPTDAELAEAISKLPKVEL